MRINSDTLRKLREKAGLSQQGLAKTAQIDKKTVARIEHGKGGEARQETVQRLAGALGIEPRVLAAEHSPESEVTVEGYLAVRVHVRHDRILAYDLVKDRYGVDSREIIEVAPLLFTLLAEMSLADRRRRLDAMDAARDAYVEAVPDHVDFARVNDCDLGWAAENKSINGRDLFGVRIQNPEQDDSWSGFVDNGSYFAEFRNPFSDFLIKLAEELGSEDNLIVNTDYGHFPQWDIFPSYQARLIGGSARAAYALTRCHVRLSEIPGHLRGEDDEDASVSTERTKWLEAKVPDEEWAEWCVVLGKAESLELDLSSDFAGSPVGGESEDANDV